MNNRKHFAKMQVIIYAALLIMVANVCTGDSYSPYQREEAVRTNVENNGHVGKKGPSSLSDYTRMENPASTCTSESAFEINHNYIIRTKDSKANGAIFVSAVKVRTYDICLEQCCLKDRCDTTVFVEGEDAYISDDANCFLFQCRPEGKTVSNLCFFTFHEGYVSSILSERGGFHSPVHPATTMPQVPSSTTSQTPAPVLATHCSAGYFECTSGQCINELYICNSVTDCDDGSDEDECSTGNDDEDNHKDLDNTNTAPKPDDGESLPPVPLTVMTSKANVSQDNVHTNGSNLSNENGKSGIVESSDEVILTRAGGGSGMPPASSAILPLVIGLVITVCLLLMVGCRLRYMNQRLRYGRLKTSAHDADYLINGMYL